MSNSDSCDMANAASLVTSLTFSPTFSPTYSLKDDLDPREGPRCLWPSMGILIAPWQPV